MKKYMAILFSVFFVGSAGVTLTKSVFTDRDTVKNEFGFVGENGMNAILTEPGWNPDNGISLLPGAVTRKDPIVTNTSQTDIDVMTAVQVEFIYSEDCPYSDLQGRLLTEDDMKHVVEVFQIDWNADESGEWIRFDGESPVQPVQHFYYKEILKRNFPGEGDQTNPLFTTLSIPSEINNDQIRRLQEIEGFDIHISGSILQHADDEALLGISSPTEAYEAGLFLFNDREVQDEREMEK